MRYDEDDDDDHDDDDEDDDDDDEDDDDDDDDEDEPLGCGLQTALGVEKTTVDAIIVLPIPISPARSVP